MKKFLINSSLILFTSVFIYPIILCIWCFIFPSFLHGNVSYRIGSNGHMYTRIQEANNSSNVDILFIGSSLSYRGFDSRIFENAGIKTFNLGSSSQTPIQSEFLLTHYLNKLNPKLIVFECSPITLENDGVESQCDLMSNFTSTNGMLSIISSLGSLKALNTYLYATFRKSLKLDENFIEPLKKTSDTYVKGGFVEKKIDHIPLGILKFNERKFKPKKYQINAFRRIKEFLKKNQKEFIIVSAPISNAKYNSWENRNEITSVLSDNSTYFEFQKLQNYLLEDTLHFYDAIHLNQKGVEIYNRALLDTLKIYNPKLVE